MRYRDFKLCHDAYRPKFVGLNSKSFLRLKDIENFVEITTCFLKMHRHQTGNTNRLATSCGLLSCPITRMKNLFLLDLQLIGLKKVSSSSSNSFIV